MANLVGTIAIHLKTPPGRDFTDKIAEMRYSLEIKEHNVIFGIEIRTDDKWLEQQKMQPTITYVMHFHKSGKPLGIVHE